MELEFSAVMEIAERLKKRRRQAALAREQLELLRGRAKGLNDSETVSEITRMLSHMELTDLQLEQTRRALERICYVYSGCESEIEACYDSTWKPRIPPAPAIVDLKPYASMLPKITFGEPL